MISVCIATYNGKNYIKQQLQSILPQLDKEDEIILVDDHSTDSTLSIVNGFSDDRIKIHINNKNMGVTDTFERAINLAQGDIIFLSDQDDVWHVDKVSFFSHTFNKNPDITLILSDANIIDNNGVEVDPSFFKMRGAFKSGVVANILKNKYLGCTMAFRKTIIPFFLPFPAKIPMHDMWIGMINDIYGKSFYIDKVLMGYRRHQYNASPFVHQGFWQMFKWRYMLVSRLTQRYIANYLGVHS